MKTMMVRILGKTCGFGRQQKSGKYSLVGISNTILFRCIFLPPILISNMEAKTKNYIYLWSYQFHILRKLQQPNVGK